MAARARRWTVPTPCDTAATAETRNLLSNLDLLASRGTLFGHQNALLHGITDHGDPGEATWYRPSISTTSPREPDVARATGAVSGGSRTRSGGYTVTLARPMHPAVHGYDVSYV